MKITNNKGLTLVELVIAMTISVLVLLFIAAFIASSLLEISESNAEAKFQEDFVSLIGVLNNYRNVFLTGSIIVDSTGTGSDVLMLTTLDKSSGILIGIVDGNTMKLESTQSQYETYNNKGIAYRDVSAGEIVDIESNISNIYNYVFFPDKIFENIKITDFQLNFYNNRNIIDLDIEVNKDYKSALNGTPLIDLEYESRKRYNLNF